MRQRRSSILRAAVLLLGVGVCVAVALRWWPPRGATGLLPPPSTVPTVLVRLHADADGAAAGEFAQGVRDTLIAHLSRMDSVRTLAPYSSEAARTWDAPRLRKRLGVSAILECAMHDGGAQLLFDCRLRDLADGRERWARRIPAALTDVPSAVTSIAGAVAAALPVAAPAALSAPPPDALHYRDYLRVRHALVVADDQRAPRLRALAAAAPHAPRIQAALARVLAENLPPGPLSETTRREVQAQLARALAGGAQLADTLVAQAILDCRVAQWAPCMTAFATALRIDPSDTDARMAYAYWLVAVARVDAAVREAQAALDADPLNSNAAFTLARVLDTAGRHAAARVALDAVVTPMSGLIYAKWFNAIWRHDWAQARQLALAMPEEAGYRESYRAVTEASIDSTLWPQALPLVRTSERAKRHANILRVMMPDSDTTLNLAALEGMLRNVWPSYYMLLWMPEYAHLRRGPAFQDFVRRTGLLDYWSKQGWPAQCKPVGEFVRCD